MWHEKPSVGLKKKDAKSTEYDLHCECVEDVCAIVF